jgi:ABC-type polysaccharide/polyol phosphate export permease
MPNFLTSPPLAVRDANSNQVAKALIDLVRGFSQWELWGTLGWHDIRQRYRRSSLGPFWLTISMGMMVGGLGVLYGGLLREPIADYLPYVAVGIITWGLISTIVLEGCTAFIAEGQIIKQQASPLSVHVYRMLWRNFIVFFHNILIYIAVVLMVGLNPLPGGALAIIGLALIYLNGVWIGILLGLISLRFRDFPPIITSATQLIFFMTPIIWRPEQIPQNASLIVDLNPFYYLIETVRTPLLGQVPPSSTWLVAAAITLLGLIVAFAFYIQFRRRIPYWV